MPRFANQGPQASLNVRRIASGTIRPREQNNDMGTVCLTTTHFVASTGTARLTRVRRAKRFYAAGYAP